LTIYINLSFKLEFLLIKGIKLLKYPLHLFGEKEKERDKEKRKREFIF
jgi:hypothetical protein